MSCFDSGEDTGTSGLSAAETSERLANRDADDSSTRPSTHLAHSSRLRQSTGTAGLAVRPATSTSLDQLEIPDELKEPLVGLLALQSFAHKFICRSHGCHVSLQVVMRVGTNGPTSQVMSPACIGPEAGD